MKKGYVYMMMNEGNTVIYTGVTSNLIKRVWEHKNKKVEGFTKKYNINKLVYYAESDSVMTAIEMEKKIKGGSRDKKVKLILAMNPDFTDLSDKL